MRRGHSVHSPEAAAETPKSLKNLHAPILYLVGGTTDVAWKNAQTDYDAIKKIPVVLADNTQSGHGGSCFAISESAVKVLPFLLALPFKSNTFIMCVFIIE